MWTFIAQCFSCQKNELTKKKKIEIFLALDIVFNFNLLGESIFPRGFLYLRDNDYVLYHKMDIYYTNND